MSSWTPPSPHPQEPLPPEEPADSPQVFYPPAGYAQPTDDAPPKKSRTGLIVGLVIGGALALLLLVVAAVVVVHRAGRSTHDIVTPATAGGLPRDAEQEKVLADRLSTAEQQFRTAFGGHIESLDSAVYSKRRSEGDSPSGPIVFLGATMKASGTPSDFVAGFRSSASARGYQVTEVDAGPGAKGVCAQSTTSVRISYCAWSTGDSLGELLPTVPGWDAAHLSSLMRDFRPDVERKAG